MSPNLDAGQQDATVRVVETIARRMGHFICGLSGHDLIRSYESGRICLRCTSCSYETPGWTITRPGAHHAAAPAAGAATPDHGRLGAVLWDDHLPAMHSPVEG